VEAAQGTGRLRRLWRVQRRLLLGRRRLRFWGRRLALWRGWGNRWRFGWGLNEYRRGGSWWRRNGGGLAERRAGRRRQQRLRGAGDGGQADDDGRLNRVRGRGRWLCDGLRWRRDWLLRLLDMDGLAFLRTGKLMQTLQEGRKPANGGHEREEAQRDR
jgi:hypothetical protein